MKIILVIGKAVASVVLYAVSLTFLYVFEQHPILLMAAGAFIWGGASLYEWSCRQFQQDEV
jgi:hypothetical protein